MVVRVSISGCDGCFRLGVTGAGLQQPVTALAALLKPASTASGKIHAAAIQGSSKRDHSQCLFLFLSFYFISISIMHDSCFKLFSLLGVAVSNGIVCLFLLSFHFSFSSSSSLSRLFLDWFASPSSLSSFFFPFFFLQARVAAWPGPALVWALIYFLQPAQRDAT